MSPNGIDWAATGTWMQAWAGFAGAVAIVLAAWVGSRTFGTWLFQRQMERKLEASERILTLIYRAQDIFRTIRSPAQWANEIESAEKVLQKTLPNFDQEGEEKKRRIRLSQIMLTRISDKSEYWKEYWELLPIARVHFGEEFERSFRTIWTQKARISSSAMTYPHIDPKRNLDFYRQCEADFWDGVGHGGGPDEIAAAIDELVAVANATILPTLRPPKVRAG